MTCEFLKQFNVKEYDKSHMTDEEKKLNNTYIIECQAYERKNCPKQRNPITITPHCWRY